MLPEFETERLVLRPVKLADAVRIQELFAQWEIVRLLHAKVPWPFPADGVMTHLRAMRVVEVKETDYVAGRLPTEVWEITAEEWRAWRRQ